MIEHVKDPKQLLYHYTRMSTALDYIFKTGHLKMSSFRKMNDPKESRTWKFDLAGSRSGDLTTKEWDELSVKLSQRFKDHARVLCFCRDVGPLSGNHMEEICQRGFARARMWAQYAETHTGVCLVFDRAKLTRQVQLACSSAFAFFQGQVSYRDRHIAPDHLGHYLFNLDRHDQVGFEQYWREHAIQFWERLFFEKNADWRDEHEYRFLAFFPDTPDIYVNMGDSLVGVIFGTEVDVVAEDALIAQLLPKPVRLMGLKWHNATPWYDFGNLKYNRQLRRSPWVKPQLPNTPT